MIVQNESELELLREGGKRLAVILKELAGMVKEDVSTQTLEDEARRLVEEGGDAPAFLGYKPQGAARPYPAALCVSVNEVIVHGIPNEVAYTFRPGDIVTLDMGLNHKGLILDSAVSVVVGEGFGEEERLVEATKEALAEAIKACVVGATMADIGAAVDRVSEKTGFIAPRELGGHGVGRSVHEEPFVPNWEMPGARTRIEEGMVLAVEPMFSLGTGDVELADDGYAYYVRDGAKTAHSEHTVYVSKDGPEILTKL